jgi:hypothetical protein
MGERREKLPEDILEKVRTVVAETSPRRVAKRWHMGADTLARALAGYEINRGTIAEIKLGLQGETK